MKENNSLRTLIVDDEKNIRRFLRVTLVSQGYSVFEAATGNEALKQLETCDPESIILDLGLPDKDGVDVIRDIRGRGIQVPIVVLSVRDQEVDKIEALDAGADDYLTKPFSAGELFARMRAVIRRLGTTSSTVLEAGKFNMDLSRHSAELDGRSLSLTPIEYEVLRVLIANAGKVVTYRQMLKEVWNKSELTDSAAHLLRVTVSKLRDKVEPNSDRPVYITTEMGIGYRLSSV